MKLGGPSAEIVICGSGITGIASAYHLAVCHGVEDVLLVDERAPLTLTSDKSTEAYRNWWPGPDDAMICLMNRSIDLLEDLANESGDRFLFNRRGYLYVTGNTDYVTQLVQTAERAEAQGAGPVRCHTGGSPGASYVPAPAEGYQNQPEGADLILDRSLIRERFPYLTKDAAAVLHARRCGWFSGQQLGMYLLQRAQDAGVHFVRARVESVLLSGGRVDGVVLRREDVSTTVSTSNFVNAAGPLLMEVGAMIGVDLPVFSERHLKASFPDCLGVVPRDAPLLIWDDPQRLTWSEEEREALAASEETRWLLDELPPAVHGRPEGAADSQNVLMLWPYDAEPVEVPTFPIPTDRHFPEIVLRGMSTMIPGLRAYFERMPRPFVDGGYYTKTRENRFLCGPLPVEGAFVIGALSGYGLMAACGAGELLAAHVTGSARPDYAPAFTLDRYDDPEYQRLLKDWGPSGQL